MELQLELELEWELKWKLEWEMELQPHKSRALQLDPPKSTFEAQNGFEALEAIPVMLFGGSGATCKTRKLNLRSRRPAIQFPLFTRGFSSKVDFQGTLGSESGSRPPNFH